MVKKTALFQRGDFIANSGKSLSFKVECDALGQKSIETLAWQIGTQFRFRRVVGVPSGGDGLAQALQKYCKQSGPTLIVDDVLTTGRSMERMRAKLLSEGHEEVIGTVIFARGPLPGWIHALWHLDPLWW